VPPTPAAPEVSPAPSTPAPPATLPASSDVPALPAAPVDPHVQAKALFAQAKEAENRADIAEAARLYDQILQLPRDAWPAGVEQWARLAHQQLKLMQK
jgi:hypothetical protein